MRKRVKPGDIISIPLESGNVCYGVVLKVSSQKFIATRYLAFGKPGETLDVAQRAVSRPSINRLYIHPWGIGESRGWVVLGQYVGETPIDYRLPLVRDVQKSILVVIELSDDLVNGTVAMANPNNWEKYWDGGFQLQGSLETTLSLIEKGLSIPSEDFSGLIDFQKRMCERYGAHPERLIEDYERLRAEGKIDESCDETLRLVHDP